MSEVIFSQEYVCKFLQFPVQTNAPINYFSILKHSFKLKPEYVISQIKLASNLILWMLVNIFFKHF